jgi:serine/threonine protein kinase
MVDRIGQQLGNYRLVRLLGQGGFAEVYLGEHVYLETEAAIKVLQTQLAGEEIEQFRREARTIAHLIHPHIVRVLEFGVEGSMPFLVMDYAPNGTLRKLHPKGARLSLTTVVAYVRQIAPALQYAHEHKLIHRDIKPENLLVGRANEVLLSDFGIALVGQSSHYQSTRDMAGTIAYMAPEQIQAHPRPASDQYALSILVYEWLSGDRPFHGSFTEIAVKHIMVPPPPLRERVPDLPGAVEQVVLTALAKDPKERFASVQAFANALEQACRLEPYPLSASNFVLPPPSTREELPPTGLAPGEPPPLAQAVPSLESLYSSAPTVPVPVVAFLPAARNTLATGSPNTSAPTASSLEYTFAKPLSRPSNPPTVPIESQARLKHNLSRRTVIRGLVALTAVGGGGVLAWLVEHTMSSPTGAQGPTATPTPTIKPTSTLSPLGTTLYIYQRHKGEVKAVAWSPDGTRIASGSADKTVQVWDATTGDHVVTYSGHSAEVKAVAWSPRDGQHIASGGLDTTVQVWDAITGSTILTYTGHSQVVRTVAWSPNGTRIASASEDKTVQVWDAITGSTILTYRGHSDKVITVAWSPDGTRIASASFDGTVQVWNSTTGGNPLIYHGHHGSVRAVAWAPDGQHLASGGADTTVQVWDATSGQLIHTYSGHRQDVQAVAWSPDGTRIASASFDTTVKVWDAATGRNDYTYTHHSNQIWAVAWSPHDGQRIASGSIDSTVQVWQAV